MNLRKIFCVVCLLGSSLLTRAQLMNAYKHNAEIGIGMGLGHYFGDLNPSAKINRPKASFGLFFRKQLNDYIGLRLTGEYAFLGYSDRYSDNPVQQRRNLSFNAHVWELGLSGDFNFFRFQPGFEGYNFTPYAGLGFGIFTYEPYAFLNGVKYQLRDLGTEGQGSALYPDLQPYTPLAFAIPFTLGVKYAISPQMNVFGEIIYRFTSTDYLDDVSGNYAPDAFPPPARWLAFARLPLARPQLRNRFSHWHQGPSTGYEPEKRRFHYPESGDLVQFADLPLSHLLKSGLFATFAP